MEPANKKARVTTLSPAVKAVAAADEATEKFAEVMNRALADATKAEAERDVLAARVAALEAHVWALRYPTWVSGSRVLKTKMHATGSTDDA
jgi:putative NADPH-quinone reductase